MTMWQNFGKRFSFIQTIADMRNFSMMVYNYPRAAASALHWTMDGTTNTVLEHNGSLDLSW